MALSAQTLPLFVSQFRHRVVVFVVCSCEIIRDWKSGDSLCYAFIEFDKVRGVPLRQHDHRGALLSAHFLRFKLGCACNLAKSH